MAALTHCIIQYGCLAVFVLLMLGIVGLPIPDETLLILVGFLIFDEVLSPMAILAALAGSLCGITGSYWLGRTFGAALIEKYGWLVNLNKQHLDRAHHWFNRFGKWTLTGGYFVPGVRQLNGFVAGTLQLQMRIFASYAYLGALFWVALFIFIGYGLGGQWLAIAARWPGVSAKVQVWVNILGLLILLAPLIIGAYLFLRKRIRQPRECQEVNL